MITLEEQAALTNQTAFDRMVRHLASMDQPAVTDRGRCRYRTSDGRACAVGCLLTDDQARRAEGKGAWELRTVLPDAPLFPAVDTDLLSQTQAIHDGCRGETFVKHLRQPEQRAILKRIAADFDLDDSVVDEVLSD